MQRWEKEENLPIHRHLHEKLGTVYAYKPELDTWWAARGERLQGAERNELRFGRRQLWLATAVTLIAVTGASVSALEQFVKKHSAPVRIESVGVLPIKNLSGDPQQDYLADGMTEALTTALGKVRELRVISWTSARQYKDTTKPLPQIARELHVDALVEGGVLRSGNRVRITAQLIEAISDRHRWAESYERELGDSLAVQDDVARAIAGAVRVEVAPALPSSARAASADPQVYEEYYRGRYYWNQRTEAGLKEAMKHFELALDKDPTYAPAYAGLADVYGLLSVWGALTSKESLSKAKAAALMALELDNSLAEAHTSLALVKCRLDWDWQGAEEEYRQAIRLNPNYATAHQWYGEFLGDMARFDEGVDQLEQAEQLDPLSPIIGSDLAMVLIHAREYDRAIKQLKKVLEAYPNFGPAHNYLGTVYVATGQFDQAIKEYENATALGPGSRYGVPSVAHAYAASGNDEQARKLIGEFLRTREGKEVPPYGIAVVYTALGEKDKAFLWLEKAYKQHSWELVVLKVTPELDPLRSDPRLAELMRRVGLPP